MSNRIIMLEDYGVPDSGTRRPFRKLGRKGRSTIRKPGSKPPVGSRNYKRTHKVKKTTRLGAPLTRHQKNFGKCSSECGGLPGYKTCHRTCMRELKNGQKK